ncbi:MAG: ABC transporter ATP-binding protein [Chelatococcus sp.]|jgi:branched-chain amino acid transport system ATP-binding protein|uniref:ABC transporter ATP-binding protein n=1 Tax=unclassified Chelatococcus TaxID=2638111 RepID=UPI001BCD532B|nr:MULTISPECIES: ABC transporter ATP-binding protein [unclassified Chelatococcus]CAH1649604.1 branched chain amino acid/phenylalanine ABC transporter ATP binding subunit LivG [Hyphomicrobiales bacterium]MBS7741741.1 ABC transporter ATP-binding protein [Chelatococcus sp. HY11]MBX3537697.1 ABC transporter ATP-binding protein [Chelatococcus sp.]MBX3541461.1 ABC transporter ATP-binding protein [Chelatococcus sp.]MCO5074645.1 ABC transporter ATP-binding protein [Chelatococcus sp.]
MENALLAVTDLSRRFGGLTAVDGLSFHVNDGEIVSIIGPNGAGKTTAFNLITCIYPPSGGAISFDGTSLVGLPLHRIAAAGIGRTFQNLRVFANLTARENVLVGMTRQARASFLEILCHGGRVRAEEKQLAAEADRLIALLELGPVADQLVRNLPYGDQRRVEIARALATNPRILLLDEPAAGMTPPEIEDLNALIRRLRDELGKTVLMVEHHMSLVMEISDRIIVMDQGRKIAEGTPDEVRSNPLVISAYLGSGVV